jgi:hypothetical protein
MGTRQVGLTERGDAIDDCGVFRAGQVVVQVGSSLEEHNFNLPFFKVAMNLYGFKYACTRR